MALGTSIRKRKQGKITLIAMGISAGILLLLYITLKATGLEKVVMDKVMEVMESVTEPPPPPPPPPPPKVDMNEPPKVEVKFDLKPIAAAPQIDQAFDPSLLRGVSNDMDAPDLSGLAMNMSDNATANLVSGSLLAPMSIATNLGDFSIGAINLDSKKGHVVGEGKRATGDIYLTTLVLPSTGTTEGADEGLGSQWSNGELENIATYISESSKVRAKLGSRAINLVGLYRSFDYWLKKSKEKVLSDVKEVPSVEPEIGALKLLGSAMPNLTEKRYDEVQRRVRKIVADYLRIKYNVRFNIEDSGWVKKISDQGTVLRAWEKEYLPEAEASLKKTMGSKTITGSEVKGVYIFLRTAEAMQVPLLLCEPPGVPGTILPDNMRLLRTYVNNGGFIYFMNSSGLDVCKGMRGLMREITQEKVADKDGEALFAKLRKDDKEISGYQFGPPDPEIFHPWTFFPMVLPRVSDVKFAVYNRMGNIVFTDTLRRKAPGTYLQRSKHYRWKCVDNMGNDVESGYYVWIWEADLHKQTGAMYVSRLRKLSSKHNIFSSYFPLEDVPTTTPGRPEDLPYGETGVFGWYSPASGGMAIVYTEGYMEKGLLKHEGTRNSQQEQALKWVTNVIFQAFKEGMMSM
jgi:hypothetical protein